MTQLLAQSEQGKVVPVKLRRITVDEYHRMIRDGYFAANERFELINGLILTKMPKNPPHSTVVGRARKLIERALSPSCHLRVQEPITLSDSEPEPDLAIVRNGLEAYATRHPGPADVELVVEVSDTTLEIDRGVKLEAYATAGIKQYLVIDLRGAVAILFSVPVNGGYRDSASFPVNSSLSLAVGDALLRINVAELLGTPD